jgi:hypothetical protein
MESYIVGLLYQNYADDAVYSGGNWVDSASIKLENLATPYMSEVARTASASPADTQFVVKFSRQQIIGGVALGAVSIRPDAQWRVRVYTDEGLTDLVYDSGTMPAPGTTVESASLEWEDDGFWEGVTVEFDDLVKGITLIHLLPSDMAALCVKFDLLDDGNPAGFLDVGRAFVGKRWKPPKNYEFGIVLSFEDLTDEEESRNGTKFFNDRNIRRVQSFSFKLMPEETAAPDLFHMIMRTRRSQQVVIVPQPHKLDTYQREAFIGTLRQLPSLWREVFERVNTDFVVEESL